MHDQDNFGNPTQYWFEIAEATEFLKADVAVEAFELLTANDHDFILAHALGVIL